MRIEIWTVGPTGDPLLFLVEDLILDAYVEGIDQRGFGPIRIFVEVSWIPQGDEFGVENMDIWPNTEAIVFAVTVGGYREIGSPRASF